MAVVYVEELFPGRGGEDGIQRKRKYARVFEVRTDDESDDAFVAGAGLIDGINYVPRNGDPHPSDPDAMMVRIRADQHADSPTLWTVTCEYDTELPQAQAWETQTINPDTGLSEATAIAPGEGQTAPAEPRPANPLDRTAVYRVTHEQASEPVEEDWQGNPILNSAGQPFDPPLEEEVSYAVVTVTKNYAGVDFDWLENFMDSVNSEPWHGRAERTCRMVAIDYEPAVENNVSFWPVTFRIKINKKTWDRRVIDRGCNELLGGLWTPITDPETGLPFQEPQLLDGAGEALAPGNDPVILTFQTKKQRAFSLLGI